MFKGHANFLDVLVDNFSSDYDDADEVKSSPQSPVTTDGARGGQEQMEEVESDSDSDSDSADWSDNSDDEDHALVRSASGQVAAQSATNRTNVGQPAAENGEDYFSQMVDCSLSTIQLEDGASRSGYSSESEDKIGGLMVTASEKLGQLMDELDFEGNDLPTATMRDVSSTERPKVQRNQS